MDIKSSHRIAVHYAVCDMKERGNSSIHKSQCINYLKSKTP